MIVGRAGRLACVGAFFLMWLEPAESQAGAAPFSVNLEYIAGPGCPDVASLKGAVIARLGHDPFIASAPDHLLVRITSRGKALDGRIEWRDAAGKWTGDQTFSVASSDCPGLARAMAFAVAVQIQLLTMTSAPAGDQVSAPVSTPPPAPPVEAPPAAQPAVPSNPPPATVVVVPTPPTGGMGPVFAIGAGPSVGLGLSSKPTVLGRLFAVVAWRKVTLELAAVVGVPTTTRRPDGAGFSQRHLLLGAAACAGATRWNVCLVANAGQARMAGEDIDRPTSARVPLVQAGARVGFIQPLGRRAFLNAHADGLANLVRWTGALDNVPVWTAPRIAAAVTLDAGVRFP